MGVYSCGDKPDDLCNQLGVRVTEWTGYSLVEDVVTSELTITTGPGALSAVGAVCLSLACDWTKASVCLSARRDKGCL